MKIKSLSLIALLLTFTLSACQQAKVEPKKEDEQQEKDEEFIDVFDDDEDGEPEEQQPEDGDGKKEDNPVPTDEVTLVSIFITEPGKKEYETGDTLDLTGLSVKAKYSDDSEKDISLDSVAITGFDNTKIGEQTIVVTYLEKTASFKVVVNKKYSEDVDSLDDIETDDFSELYAAFATKITNYSSKTESFFNKDGAYYYYKHYDKNCVQNKVNFYTEDTQYSYPLKDEYLEIQNTGYFNSNNNYYSFSLKGDTVSERLASKVNSNDLKLVKENSCYQNDLFTLEDLNEDYFKNHSFIRVSENKYQSSGDVTVYNDFTNICAPQLINTGYYMTFSRVTIELNPFDNVAFRARLYASTTQTGKLIDTSLDKENRPNWYLLFAEALIYDVGQTTFAPTEDL